MAGEEWARRIVEKELRRSVVVNDDGSRDGMYDLRIGPADAPELAVECVGAVDPIRAETWSEGPSKGPLELALRGDWIIAYTQCSDKGHQEASRAAAPGVGGSRNQ